MKILYDYQAFQRQKYGGISRYFYELITRISDAPDTEILLWLGRHINKYRLEDYRNKFSYFHGKRVNLIPKTKMLNLWSHKPFFKRFLGKTDFDILHQTFYCDYGKKKNTKQFVTVHDFTPEKYTHHFSRLNNAIKDKKNTADRSDGIICISNNTKKDLLELYSVPESKIRVIYHGNSLKMDAGTEPVFKTPYILFVGDRKAYKNFRLLVDSVASSPRLKDFNILCFGGGGLTKQETEFIAGKSMQGRVIQTEGNDAELANAYKFAEVFVYPSLYEGFGIPLLEAMHYGCPILASNTSCFPEIASDAAVYFDPLEKDELISGLELIISDSDLRKSLVMKGINRESQFSWDKCASETLEFYRSV